MRIIHYYSLLFTIIHYYSLLFKIIHFTPYPVRAVPAHLVEDGALLGGAGRRPALELRDPVLRSEVNIELNFPPKLRGASDLGCIDADFCK